MSDQNTLNTRTGARVADSLLAEPYGFDFFQAVHLLEQLRPERSSVGHFADPSNEVVRFETQIGAAFPASEIQKLVDSNDAPAEMTVNFLGLTGPQGVLPLDYTLYAAQRDKVGDRALKDFIGLFEHRIISLFYRAWAKSHAAIRATNGKDTPSGASDDLLTQQLLSIVGMSTPGLGGRQPISDESLLYYAGLLAMPSRPAAALEQLVSDYFDVPCEVEQFVGSWYPLQATAQTLLSDDDWDGFGGLGTGAVAGDEVWDQQGRVRLRIGPLSRRHYDEFLPGGASHDALQALTRFFGNDQFDFEIQLVLARDEAPACRLDPDDVPLPLGWATWLRTAPLDRDPDDARFTL